MKLILQDDIPVPHYAILQFQKFGLSFQFVIFAEMRKITHFNSYLRAVEDG